MALTNVGIRNAKSGARVVKLADRGGIFLLITPAEGILRRLKYRVDGREKLRARSPAPAPAPNNDAETPIATG